MAGRSIRTLSTVSTPRKAKSRKKGARRAPPITGPCPLARQVNEEFQPGHSAARIPTPRHLVWRVSETFWLFAQVVATRLCFATRGIVPCCFQSLSRRFGPGTRLVELEVLAPVHVRLGRSAGLMQCLGLVDVRVGAVGVNVERDVEGVDGGRQLAPFGANAADLNPGFEVVVVELGGNVVAFERAF